MLQVFDRAFRNGVWATLLPLSEAGLGERIGTHVRAAGHALARWSTGHVACELGLALRGVGWVVWTGLGSFLLALLLTLV